MKEGVPAPINYPGVMISSTFTDLEAHRAELMKALEKQDLFPIGMEKYIPNPDDDVISSSLSMVGKGSAYIGCISHRYGQVPVCPDRNPHAYSVTRLEFEEALRLKRPTLIFIMSNKHLGTIDDFETDTEKREKLTAFRDRGKEGRIYVEFQCLQEFTEKAIHAVAQLRRYLEEGAPTPTLPPDTIKDPIPVPPAFYAEPPYIGSHQFLGRKAQIEVLNDWAVPADSHPVLLFEAIGGTGKSMLTWEWTTKHASGIRKDWAGRFWYSFYERGAVMADFCRRALTYITGRPLEEYQKKTMLELSEMLLHHLHAKPWLMVLDGLERVLVAYHRLDASQLADEDAGESDGIADRDPCSAIRPEDDEFLRALAGATPSKLLLTSRLIPLVLLNASSQPIPGVLRERLSGLRPPDAEDLFRACGVFGDSNAIQHYLQQHCDCHPLVTGVLAGIITNYLPDRKNFDAWVENPDGGGSRLNLADLDLVQKRNHILNTALSALDDKSRQLLSTLALLSQAADFPTLSALNPHLPPEPERVEEPTKPEEDFFWESLSDNQKGQAQQDYEYALTGWEANAQAKKDRLASQEFLAAPLRLQETVGDLKRRGLLQYDHQTKRYDLHPVVRGIAAGRLRQEEREQYGQRVVDHFSQQLHAPFEEAETVDDFSGGLQVVRTLIQMDRFKQAYDVYRGFARALLFNLEAHAENLSLLRPFFPQGWDSLPRGFDKNSGVYLANEAAGSLDDVGDSKGAFAAYGTSLRNLLELQRWSDVRVSLSNISGLLAQQNHLAQEERCLLLALDLAAQQWGMEHRILARLNHCKENLFVARLNRFNQLARTGRWNDANVMWQLLDPMGRHWAHHLYRAGEAEYYYARFRFYQGDMTAEHLCRAEKLSTAAKDRLGIRWLHGLRGEWQLEQGRYAPAVQNLHEAVRMAREVGRVAAGAETHLALATLHLGQLADPRSEAHRLAKGRDPAHRPLADLWMAIGDPEQAKRHALAAYQWACADGEPYVHRYELEKSGALLIQLGVEIPAIPHYDATKDDKLPWQDAVAAAIAKLRADNDTMERLRAV